MKSRTTHFVFLALAIAFPFALVACSKGTSLSIDITPAKGGFSGTDVTIRNSTETSLAYLPNLLDDPYDLSRVRIFSPSLRPDNLGFLLALVDSNGRRYLSCGIKDATPKAEHKRLSPGASVTMFSIIDSSFACAPKDRALSWQVFYIRSHAGQSDDLSKPEAYTVIYSSNLVPFAR